MEEIILSEDGVWCGVIVTPKTDKLCEYGNRVPDIYWWVDQNEDGGMKIELSPSWVVFNREAYEND